VLRGFDVCRETASWVSGTAPRRLGAGDDAEMGTLLLQETFFDQGMNESGGPRRAFPHGLNQFLNGESRGYQEGFEDQAPDLAVGIGKGGLPLVMGAPAIGIGGGVLEHGPVIHEGIVQGRGCFRSRV